MVKAERLIDELLGWDEETEGLTLTDIEDVVLGLRKELGQEMAEVVVSMQEGNRPVPGPACPQCGREMRYKGQKGNTVESRVGTLKTERGHYHCSQCGEGFFPPGSATGAEGRPLERGGCTVGRVAERSGVIRAGSGDHDRGGADLHVNQHCLEADRQVGREDGVRAPAGGGSSTSVALHTAAGRRERGDQ